MCVPPDPWAQAPSSPGVTGQPHYLGSGSNSLLPIPWANLAAFRLPFLDQRPHHSRSSGGGGEEKRLEILLCLSMEDVLLDCAPPPPPVHPLSCNGFAIHPCMLSLGRTNILDYLQRYIKAERRITRNRALFLTQILDPPPIHTPTPACSG